MKLTFFIIINSILFFSMLITCYSQTVNDYTGEILMYNPNNGLKNMKDYRDSVLIYQPRNNSYSFIAKDNGFTEVSFSDDKKRILGLASEQKIIEYDISTKKISTIYEGNKQEASYDFIKYIPSTDCISFISYPSLYIFNRKTKELKKQIISIYGDYSWSKDGKLLFYSNKGKTYCWDITKQKQDLYINDGSSPQLSASNEYIVFKTQRNNLTVREMKTGKEWHYRISIKVYYYKFSPDDKYLAIEEQVSKKDHIEIDLRCWDFKNNKTTTFIENIYNGSFSNFDWK